jgi:hypothetical protein
MAYLLYLRDLLVTLCSITLAMIGAAYLVLRAVENPVLHAGGGRPLPRTVARRQAGALRITFQTFAGLGMFGGANALLHLPQQPLLGYVAALELAAVSMFRHLGDAAMCVAILSFGFWAVEFKRRSIAIAAMAIASAGAGAFAFLSQGADVTYALIWGIVMLGIGGVIGYSFPLDLFQVVVEAHHNSAGLPWYRRICHMLI